jgi:hypothetical protein
LRAAAFRRFDKGEGGVRLGVWIGVRFVVLNVVKNGIGLMVLIGLMVRIGDEGGLMVWIGVGDGDGVVR